MKVKEQTKNEIGETQHLVEHFLKVDPRCRDNDTWLIINVMNAKLKPYGERLYVPYHLINQMGSFETITRCRRKVQEQHPSLQGSKKAIEKRANREVAFRQWSVEA